MIPSVGQSERRKKLPKSLTKGFLNDWLCCDPIRTSGALPSGGTCWIATSRLLKAALTCNRSFQRGKGPLGPSRWGGGGDSDVFDLIKQNLMQRQNKCRFDVLGIPSRFDVKDKKNALFDRHQGTFSKAKGGDP